MKFNVLIGLFFLLLTNLCYSQSEDITSQLYETYDDFKETSLDKRRIKHHQLQPLIGKLRQNPRYTVRKVGSSIDGRDLTLISIGTGPTDVFLWSQMHGNEPTATQAIFDLFNFLNGSTFKAEKKEILSNLTLHFLPMLNPDGAEEYKRRNTLGIDINRDALRLQSPEGQTLKVVRDSLEADFGFNLHDQSTYYNAERTEKPATISYLAPPYNYEKEINSVRANAMKVIVFMDRILQKYAPGQVGRYSDDFEPRAFGDNIQKWGTSAILIESGGYANDIEKQEIRKLNYVSILSAIYTIANGSYEQIPIEDYEKIPHNDRKLFDLKLTGVTYPLLGKKYTMDIGIHRLEVDNEKHDHFYNSSRIIDLGDLSTYYGYETLEAAEYTIKAGAVAPHKISALDALNTSEALRLLKQGYTYVRVANMPLEEVRTSVPIHAISENYEVPELRLKVGVNPTFLLEKDGLPHYAVINGFLINLQTDNLGSFKNALIFR